jgi:hypothetical protein
MRTRYFLTSQNMMIGIGANIEYSLFDQFPYDKK